MQRDLQEIMTQRSRGIQKKYNMADEIFSRFSQAMDLKWVGVTASQGDSIIEACFDITNIYRVVIVYHDDLVKTIIVRNNEKADDIFDDGSIDFRYVFDKGSHICSVDIKFNKINNHKVKKFIADIVSYIINEESRV